MNTPLSVCILVCIALAVYFNIKKPSSQQKPAQLLLGFVCGMIVLIAILLFLLYRSLINNTGVDPRLVQAGLLITCGVIVWISVNSYPDMVKITNELVVLTVVLGVIVIFLEPRPLFDPQTGQPQFKIDPKKPGQIHYQVGSDGPTFSAESGERLRLGTKKDVEAMKRASPTPAPTTSSRRNVRTMTVYPTQWTEPVVLPPYYWFEIDWSDQYLLDVMNVSGEVVRIRPSDNLPDSSDNRKLRFRAGGPYSFDIKFSMAPK